MNKAQMMQAISQATGFPPVARALAFAALAKAKTADVEKLSAAIDLLTGGATVESVVASLELGPEASGMALAFLNSNPKILEVLKNGSSHTGG